MYEIVVFRFEYRFQEIPAEHPPAAGFKNFRSWMVLIMILSLLLHRSFVCRFLLIVLFFFFVTSLVRLSITLRWVIKRSSASLSWCVSSFCSCCSCYCFCDCICCCCQLLLMLLFVFWFCCSSPPWLLFSLLVLIRNEDDWLHSILLVMIAMFLWMTPDSSFNHAQMAWARASSVPKDMHN